MLRAQLLMGSSAEAAVVTLRRWAPGPRSVRKIARRVRSCGGLGWAQRLQAKLIQREQDADDQQREHPVAAARLGPIIYHGGRQLGTGQRRADSLVYGAAPLDTLPGRVIGVKPAVVCRWIFTLLGAAPSDILDDLFPGSGAVSRAWAAYTGQQPWCKARADASSPAASDASYPSSEASHDGYAELPLDLPRDRPRRAGDGSVPWPGSLPGPWFLGRVLPEARCQGWPKDISEGNTKRP